MEDKQHLDMENGRRTKSSYLQGVSILILSLLLCASVGAVIYMSLKPVEFTKCEPTDTLISQETEVQQQSVKDEAHLKIKSQDGSQITEDVEYDEARNLAIYHGPAGELLVEDFEKGINIMKDTRSGVCYVVPVGTEKVAGQKLMEFLKGYDGQEIQTGETKKYQAKLLPGTIEDTSIFPPEANEECGYYQWLSVIGELSDTDDAALGRYKRSYDYDWYFYPYYNPFNGNYGFNAGITFYF